MGMAAALDEAMAHLEEHTVKVTALRDKLIAGLSKIPHCVLNGDAVNRLPGNVSFCFEGIEGEALLLLLDAKGVAAPPAPPVPPAPWTPAMCCWPSADPTRSPTAPCA